MSRYAFLRWHKVKSFAKLAGLSRHMERTKETPNADPARTPLNERLAGSGDWVADVRSRLGRVKIRANAVLALEYLMTTSPEWFAMASDQQKDAWKEASMAWLREIYGADNVVAAILHLDETTPHIQALVVPIDGMGHLNSRFFVGGTPGRAAELQSSYAACVAHLGLVRGVEHSVAHHEDIRRWYGRMQESERAVDLDRVVIALGDKYDQKYGHRTIGGERVSVEGDRWRVAGRSGTGAIELIQGTTGYSEREAIVWLAHALGPEVAVAAATQHARLIVERDPRPPFRAPERDEKQWDQVRGQLVGERFLPAETVDQLYDEGKLYAGKGGHAVWLHQDEAGQVIGATLEREDAYLAPGSCRDEGWFAAAFSTERDPLPSLDVPGTPPYGDGSESGSAEPRLSTIQEPGDPARTVILADTPAEALAVAELHRRLYDGRTGLVATVALEDSRRLPEQAIRGTLAQGGVVRVAVKDDRLAERIRDQLPEHDRGQVTRDRPELGTWCAVLRWHELMSRDPERADRELRAMWRRDRPREEGMPLRPRARERLTGRDGYDR